MSSGQRSAVGRAGSVPPSVVACFSVAYRSGFCSWVWSYPAGFLFPSPLPLPLFPLLSSVWQVPGWLLVGAHGWVAGIASHGSVSLSRGWLISVEAPRHPRHLSSIQLDAVVNMLNSLLHINPTRVLFLTQSGLNLTSWSWIAKISAHESVCRFPCVIIWFHWLFVLVCL